MKPLAMTFSKVRDQLGVLGIAAFAVFALAGALLVLAVGPLEAENASLAERLESGRQAAAADRSTPDGQLLALYRHLETKEERTDFLAKLHALSEKAGAEIRTADYQVRRTPGPIERYEIALVAAGSYAQVRAFLANALIQIPVLSLDQVKFKRQHADDGRVRAEINLTLHVVKP